MRNSAVREIRHEIESDRAVCFTLASRVCHSSGIWTEPKNWPLEAAVSRVMRRKRRDGARRYSEQYGIKNLFYVIFFWSGGKGKRNKTKKANEQRWMYLFCAKIQRYIPFPSENCMHKTKSDCRKRSETTDTNLENSKIYVNHGREEIEVKKKRKKKERRKKVS